MDVTSPAAGIAGRVVVAGAVVIPDRRRPRTFLPHVHRLRAIAIIFIVTVHCIGALHWNAHPATGALLHEVFDNSSVLFLFVAGFLFQHLSRGFRFDAYLQKKAANVLLPYLIIATPAVVFALMHRGELLAAHPGLKGHPLAYDVGWLYINGGATMNPALWFVPVILLFYAAAPLFILFEKHPRLYGLLWVLLPLSLLAHRPIYDGGHNFEFLLYFLSAYVLGMYCGHGGSRALKIVRIWLPWMLAAFLAIVLGHAFLASNHGLEQVPHIFSFQNGIIDWLYLQKILLALILLAALSYANDRDWGVLDYLAEVSFTIYFVHMYLLYVLWRETSNPVIEGNPLYVVLLMTGVVAASCAVSMLGRRLFGKRSRLLVGS